MALIVVVEDGSGLANSNSYCSVVESDTYHETRLHSSTWTTAATADKETAIVYSTRLLDEMIDWNGSIMTDDQALRWPRDNVYDSDARELASDEIPTFLVNATSEFARLLLDGDRQADSDTLGFKELKAGPLEMVIDKYDRASVMPNSVWDIIKFYGKKTSGQIRTLQRA